VNQHNESKEKKIEAQNRFKELSDRIAPTLQSINAKETYKSQIQIVVEERKQALKAAERDADNLVNGIDALERNAKNIEAEVNAILDTQQRRKIELRKLDRDIAAMKARLINEPRIEFSAAEWNERVVSVS
jgi:chromosome segregation ATPase